jgi:hypothetical protein
MSRRSRDTRSGYGARLPAPAFLAKDSGPGTGHVSPGRNMRMCLRCATMRPTKDGRMLPNGAQICAMVHPKKAAA